MKCWSSGVFARPCFHIKSKNLGLRPAASMGCKSQARDRCARAEAPIRHCNCAEQTEWDVVIALFREE
jgi:hypothetical protein